jgi:FkbM family methyltransferase
MLYRFQKSVRTRIFNHAIAGIFDTAPMQVKEASCCIVSMVANGDVPMYLLALKSFYPKLGRGKVVAIIDRDMPQASRDILTRHIVGLEFVTLEDIPTGPCQRGGTWERLLYVLDRSEQEYTIQLDSDTLTVSEDIDEVVRCVDSNTAFTISDGFELMSLPEVAQEAEATPSDYIGIVTERMFARYPRDESLQYVRGSSGFAGFSRGGFTREAITEFHQTMESLVGARRWREWGTEQCGSNFAIANSPGSVVLPRPEYASFTPRVPPADIKFFHFIGAFRYRDGYYAARGREVIERLRNGVTSSRTVTAIRRQPDDVPRSLMLSLDVASASRYAAWRALGQPHDIWLRTRTGSELHLRACSGSDNDAGLAQEIFGNRELIPPVWIPPERVKLIVDVGTAAGLSPIYWLTTYWATRVIAFELQARNAAQCRVNMRRNHLEARGELHLLAMDITNGCMSASRGENSSQPLKRGEFSQINIDEFFTKLAGRRIDILKVDIGSRDREILEDSRFSDLDVRVLAVVSRAAAPDASACKAHTVRLAKLGFRPHSISRRGGPRIQWGYRRQKGRNPSPRGRIIAS